MSDCLIGCITSDDEGRGYYCEECPELRKSNDPTLIGPDGFTRLDTGAIKARLASDSRGLRHDDADALLAEKDPIRRAVDWLRHNTKHLTDEERHEGLALFDAALSGAAMTDEERAGARPCLSSRTPTS